MAGDSGKHEARPSALATTAASVISATTNRRVMRRFRLALLAVGLCAATLATSPLAQEPDSDQLEKIRGCHKQATIKQEIRLNAGVVTEQVQIQQPLSIEIPTTVDQALLEDCLVRGGLSPDVAKVAYFEMQRDCRERARSGTVRIADEGGAPRIGGLDQAAYDRCMRGVIEVEVE